jgi:hypothetical protein
MKVSAVSDIETLNNISNLFILRDIGASFLTRCLRGFGAVRDILFLVASTERHSKQTTDFFLYITLSTVRVVSCP